MNEFELIDNHLISFRYILCSNGCWLKIIENLDSFYGSFIKKSLSMV